MKRIYTFLMLAIGIFSFEKANAACPVVPGSISTADKSICSGTSPGTINASASSDGNGILFYIWQKSTNSGTSWSVVTGSGVNNEDYTPGSLTTTTWFKRTTVDLGGCASQETGVCKITVDAPVGLTTSPTDDITCAGGNASFSVTASGSNLSYQWQEDKGSGFFDLAEAGIYSNTQTSTLSLTGVSSSENGYEYRCEVSGTVCSSSASSSAELTVQTSPSITSAPSDEEICQETDATFTVVAAGSSISYQWQEDKGSGFNDLTDDATYSGSTTTSLTISSAPTTMDGYDYRVVVSNSNCTDATSASANLDVVVKPVVTASPANVTDCVGEDVDFSVTATGDNLTYQWQENDGGGFTDISADATYTNVTTSTLTIVSVGSSIDGYSYRCVVDNSNCDPAFSNAGTITIETAPNVTTQPSSSTVCVDGDPTFSVSATGAALTYRWQFDDGSGYINVPNGGVYSGEQSATLSITDATAGMDGYKYKVLISGTCSPSAESNEATLNVEVSPSITSNPTSKTVCENDDPTFTVAASGAGLTYKWQYDTGSGFTDVPNSGVYSNVTSATLTITDATTAMSGYIYRCEVSGNCTPAVNSSSATLTVQETPSFSVNPTDETYCTGSDVDLEVTVTGTSLSLKWQEDDGGGFADITANATYSGVTSNTLTITAAGAGLDGYDYRVVATNSSCGSVNSSSATLTEVASPSITSNPTNTTACEDDDPTFSVSATGSGLIYTWQVDEGSGYSDIAGGSVYSDFTTATLKITDATTAMNGYDYRCMVSSNSCPTATSTAATLTVNSKPSISVNPTNQSECDGGDVTFSVTASGTGIAYVWQEDQGSGFVNITIAGKYSNPTANSLKITGITSSFDGYDYRAVVSGTCTPSVTSTGATLSVINSVAISSQPTATTVCVDDDPTFSVTASGGTVSYQWQVDNGGGYVDIAGGGIYTNFDKATLNITDATASEDGYLYRCRVSSTCGSPINSNGVALNVDVAPVITSNPGDLTKCASDAANFSVTAGFGTNLGYQWQEDQGAGFADLANAGIYSGTDGSSLTISSVSLAMDGYDYRCIVSNTGCGSTTSGSASLSINQAPSITAQSSDITECVGDDASFSVTATGAGLSYQWQENKGSGYTAVSSSAPYSGGTTNALTISSVTSTIDGYVYRCVITGTCNPSATTSDKTLTVQIAPDVTVDPSNVTICENSNTSFSATAIGDNISFRWQVDQGSGFSDVSGAIYSNTTTATLSLSSVPSSMDSYKYRCIVSNSSCDNDTSAEATLTVQAAPNVTADPSDVTICESTNTSLSVTATGSSIGYQWQVDQGSGFGNVSGAVYSNASTATLSISSAPSSMDGYKYRCVVSNSSCSDDISAEATLTVEESPSVTADPSDATICENSNTSFSVTSDGTNLSYQWQVDQGSGFGNVSGAVYSNSTTATLSISSAPSSMDGYKYRCVVSNSSCSDDMSAEATLTVEESPNVTADPSDATICENSNTSFSVTSDGTNLSYQWQVDQGSGFGNVSGAVYSNSTTATLSISSAPSSMDGYEYRCVVSNSTCVDDISAEATLTVEESPSVTADPSDVTICESTNTSFSVTSDGTNLSYQWQVDQGSGFGNVSGAVYSNSTTATLSISSAPSSMDGYKYRCVVSNTSCTSDISGEATLTIEATPTVTSNPADKSICAASNTTFGIVATGDNLSYQWQVDAGSGYTAASGGVYSNETSTTLTITSAPSSMDGYKYRCVVSNPSCPDDISGEATLSVAVGPTVTTNPIDAEICEGGDTSFTIAASGSSLVYQWQVDQGSGYSDVSGAVYSGINSVKLVLTNVPASFDGYKYKCLVGNAACTDLETNEATLTVIEAPSVTTNPSNTTVCETGNTNLSIVSDGDNLTYQWQFDQGSGFSDVSGAVYSGDNSATLSITGATTGMDGYKYRCVVDNATCTADISGEATLTVQETPSVTSNPTSASICESANTSFAISATGSSLSFQWQVDEGSGYNNVSGAVYSNSTTATLTITSAPSSMDGYKYRCVVSNSSCSDDISGEATLTVQETPTVTSNPSNTTICENSNTSFSISATGDALDYQWQVDEGSGFVNVTGSAYSGITSTTLSITNATTSFDGFKYRCEIDNTNCSADISGEATLSVAAGPVVTTNPSDALICEGQDSSFSVVATGTSLTYQWQVDEGSGYNNVSGAVYSGITSATLDLTNVPNTFNTYKYKCLIGNSVCTGLESNEATLTVQTSPSVTTNPSNVDVCDGGNTSFTIAASGSTLDYQWQVDQGSGFSNVSGTEYSGITSTTLSITGAAIAKDGYLYRCEVSNASCSPDVSNAATLNIKALPSITSSPSDITVCVSDDPTFSVSATGDGITYQWQYDDGTGFTDAPNSGIFSDVTTSTITLTNVTAANDGFDLRCVVSGDCTPDATSNVATLTVQTPPSVTSDPSDASVCIGGNTSFTVGATGSALDYQWQVDNGAGFADLSNGGVYSNTDAATLNITGVTTTLVGLDYRCVVKNTTCSDAISNSATIVEFALPNVTSNPSSQTLCESENTSFSVSATGDGLAYQWQENDGTGFADLSNTGIYTGATTSTLTLTSVTTAESGNQYRCEVSGTCSPADISTAATLTVDATPTITSQPISAKKCESENWGFAVSATGTSLSYQWQIWNGAAFTNVANAGKYNGATNSSLTIFDIDKTIDSTYYRCIVSGPNCPSVITDTVMLDVMWRSTAPSVIATDSSFCDGNSTELFAFGGIEGDTSTIEWYTGPNGSGVNFASGAGPFVVSPSDTTTYYVRREGKCNTTVDSMVTINVQPKPTADFVAYETCEGQATLLFDSSEVVQDSITNYSWDLGDGSKSSLRNVISVYSSAGTYDVQLVVETQNGCTDTVTKTTTIFEQPSADFSLTSDCLGEITEFTDNSSINGTATLAYSWDFGDGKGSSNLQNPEYIYNSTGGYTVELKVTSSDGCIDSISKSNTIYTLPIAEFNFDNACLGDAVDFSNKSKIGKGTLTYEWDFDDGNSSTTENTTNSYSTVGTYNVELIATSNQGCKDTIVQEVETYGLPTADFNFASACEGDFVSFSDNSSNPTSSKLTYEWDFDNGSSSTSKNPQNRYTASGSYDVELIVTSAEGCIDDVTKSVDVYGAPIVNFTSNKVCDGFATTFTNGSRSTDAGTLTYLWRFGDGDTSRRVAPSHSYASAGTFTATLIATSSNGCVDSTTSVVTIYANPVANYRLSNICEVDSAEFFNLSSVPTGTYTSLWKFGDNSTSTRRSPKHLYASDNTYSTKLIITSNNGCEDSTSQNITIYPMPEPDFTFNDQCNGDEVDFVNTTAVKTGTQFVWAFGDGFGSTTEEPSHTYLNAGSYNATLTATTANGCKETTPAQQVTIHPRINLSFNTANVCDNDTVYLTNTSFLSSGTATYAWNFGDGNGVIGLNNAKHVYDTFGVYGVTLYGRTDNNCVDSVKAQVEVYAQPIAKYTVASGCLGTFNDFTNNTILANGVGVSYIWDFADGFSSSLKSPKHQYQTFGTYNTELIAITNDGCIDTAARTHNVWPNPEADFKTFGTSTNEVSELCIYETANFTDLSTIDAGKVVNWTWNFGDATSQSGLRNVQKNYLLAGVYEVELVAESDSGCIDVLTQKIEILPKPAVAFTFNDTCETFDVQFRNQSTVDKGQISYIWDFGDNEKSTLREPIHAYQTAGTYPVSLIGISTDGCTDTAGPSDIIIHEIPDATIASNIGGFEFCEGDSAVLSVPFIAGYTYLWSTGESTNEITVKTGGVYSVTITSAFGCENTSQELITVWTRPTADAGPDVTISKGYSTELKGSGALFFEWTPGSTLSDSLIQNPIATPLEDENYQLIVEDANGCLDTANVNVFVEEDYKLEPADIFTPNGDGINDVWVIKNITTYPDCDLTITNRWQQVIYTQSNYDNTWDGSFGGNSLPTGAYNYLIKCGNGRIYTGTVNILR